jgi:metallo-beta-lactamase family protein
MATGGRILHHLKTYAPDWRNSILFSGFQAGGTRGAAMLDGVKTIKIHGQYIAVNAHVDNLSMLSAHADADELMAWLSNFKKPPRMTFITHGEPAASDALRMLVEDKLKWTCRVPEHGESIVLDA